MPKTLSLLAVLKKIDAKGIKSLSDAQWNTFLASDTEPNEIQEKIAKLEGYEQQGAAYDKTGEVIVEDNNAMIERFRQRTGRAKGRESLKVKKSKIDVKSFKEKFLDKDEEPVKPDTTGASDLVKVDKPPDLSKPVPVEEKETEGLKGIRDVLDDILKVLRLDFKGDRKEARDAQKEAAKDKREKREDKLEGGVKKSLGVIGKAVGAMMKPFSGIWDSIINWIKFTLIGVLFQKTLKWFSDPKNKKKAERIGKFFKDWWPALAGAAALFLTPLGALISGMTGLLTAIIPKLVMAIAANPWAAAAVLGGVAIWGISKRIGGGDKKQKPGDDEGDEGSGDTTTTSEQYTEVAGERFDPNNPTEEQQQAGQLKENMANSRQGMNEGGLVQSSLSNQSSRVQNYHEGGLVQSSLSNQSKNYHEGGLVQSSLSNQSSRVQNYHEGGLVQQFKPTKSGGFKMGSFFAGGGLVNYFNEGGMVGKELVYSLKKFKTEKVVKGDEIEKIKTREKTVGSIKLEDLYENQDQILSQLPEGTTIESIVNGTSDIDAEILYPILQNSDAQMASTAKERAATMQMMQENNLINSDNTVKGHSSYNQNFKGGGEVQGFNKGGEVPGSGNKDTVPAMLTPGEFVMSKGAVQKYGSDTLEGMNAAAGGSGSQKNDTVPSMLTPGEFVVSAPAVQKFGVDTMESMNLKGGGNNKPELKAPDESVTANKGGLINNYRNTQSNHYSTGGLVQYLQGGGSVNKPQGMMRWLAGAADVMTGGLTDFDQRGSIIDGAQRLVSKEPLETPVSSGVNKVVTLPPITKPTPQIIPAKSTNDIPDFRISIISHQRSMVISELGIQDLVGGV